MQGLTKAPVKVKDDSCVSPGTAPAPAAPIIRSRARNGDVLSTALQMMFEVKAKENDMRQRIAEQERLDRLQAAESAKAEAKAQREHEKEILTMQIRLAELKRKIPNSDND